MKWECLAIVLENPLKEEWVSIFRILFQIPLINTLLSLTRCNGHFRFTSPSKLSFFPPFLLFTRKLLGYGPHGLWNGPPWSWHGSYGGNGPDGHGKDGPCI